MIPVVFLHFLYWVELDLCFLLTLALFDPVIGLFVFIYFLIVFRVLIENNQVKDYLIMFIC